MPRSSLSRFIARRAGKTVHPVARTAAHGPRTGALARTVVACVMALAALATTADEAEQRLVRQAIDVARELRNSESTYDQFSGAGTLVEIGDKEALQFLADSLGHSDWVLKRSAIDTLLDVQHPSALDLIYRYTEVSGDRIFMKFLAESLASKPREDMVEFLLKSLETDDMWVKKHALQALARSPMYDKEGEMRAIAEDPEQDSVSRSYAWYALMDTDAREESAKKLIEIAQTWGPEAQEAAAVGLGMVNSDASRAALKSLRDAKTYKVQVAALASEAGFGNQTSIDTLVRLIATGKGLDPSVAVAAIRRIPPKVAARITTQLLECCKLNSDVATRLLESWAFIDTDATSILEWGLGNENPDIRMQAVWLVGARDDARWIERIAPFLEDTDLGIRSMAAWAIVRLLGDQYQPGLEA